MTAQRTDGHGAAFAPGVQVPAQAGLLDQILALLGRDPSWSQ